MTQRITRAHGTGGRSTHELIRKLFLPFMHSELLSPDDAAEVPWQSGTVVVTTDTTVVDPLEFPGGNAGKLSITGGINDLLTRGTRARFAAMGFVLGEDLGFDVIARILKSIQEELANHDIKVICADTKVIASGEKSGLFINTTLFGAPINPDFHLPGIKPGDALIVTGNIGTHGLALLQARQNLPFKTVFESDCASLLPLLEPEVRAGTPISYMRDVTRGGLAGILHELAVQFDVGFRLEESSIPVQAGVRSGLALLGIDPLEVANEGVMLIAIPIAHADALMQRLKQNPLGSCATQVGRVVEASRSALVMVTTIGGERIVPWPEALGLPRIC